MRLFLADEAATIDLGRRFLEQLPLELAGWTVLLGGELGAGKSTFARAMIRAAGHTGPVPSPTYTLVEPYTVSRGAIYHVDLYRISSEEELRYLGWDELDDGFRLVEWPERAPGLAAQADVAVTLIYDGDGRSARLDGLSERGARLVEAIADS
jgi:tRNA threonylcarbamoyladenosine biosynthesis protein TsaE